MIIAKYNQWRWPWPLVTSHARRSEPPTLQLVRRDVDLVSDMLPFSQPWYGEPNAISKAVGYARDHSRSHDAVISSLLYGRQRDRKRTSTRAISKSRERAKQKAATR